MSQFPGSKNVRTKNYKSLLNGMPQGVGALAKDAFKLFLKDANHPMLALHDLKDNRRGQHQSSSYSVSVTYRIRAIFTIDGDTNVWYWIGTHEAYNSFTGVK
jgi:hypothetical protein